MDSTDESPELLSKIAATYAVHLRWVMELRPFLVEIRQCAARDFVAEQVLALESKP